MSERARGWFDRALFTAFGAALGGLILAIAAKGTLALAEEKLATNLVNKSEFSELKSTNDIKHQEIDKRLQKTEDALIEIKEVKSNQANIETKVAVAVNQQNVNTAKLSRIEDKLDRLLERGH